MSGGVAYVYDPFERFEQNCNLELVDLYADEEAEDEALVHGLIKEHLERTGSTAASAILGDWFEAKQKFVKVYPRDYKRVLDAQKAAALNAAEAKALEAEDAFAKLVSMSSLADEAEKTNNALPLKVRPTRTETPKKLRGFVDYEREPLGYRDPNERLTDWNEVHRHDGAEATKSLLATQSARCMDCGTPFCHQTNTGCPLGNKIPEWNELGAPRSLAGRAGPAARNQQLPRVHRPGLPGAVRGVVHPGHHREPGGDQEHRVLHRGPRVRGGLDRAHAARRAHGQEGERDGSGPAGMAAADQLNKARATR